jgi:pimeloyl-ACP methyl ester carboxylesterase
VPESVVVTGICDAKRCRQRHRFPRGRGRFWEPLLLLHGYPQSGETWRSVAPRLANSVRRVVIPDLRGMGLSGIAPDGYGLPQLADDFHQIARQLGITEVDVVGHDWGGAVAAVYALSHRAEVRRLVFIESAVGGAGFEDVWSFTQPNPAMTFIPLLLSGELTEPLISGRDEVYLHHLWDTFTANKDRAPFDSWAPYLAALKRPAGRCRFIRSKRRESVPRSDVSPVIHLQL